MTKRRDDDEQLSMFAEWEIGVLPAKPERAPRRPDPLWDAVSAIWGEVANEVERARRNKAVAILRESEPPIDPHEVALLAAAYRACFPSSAFTVLAMASRVGELRHYLANGRPSGEDVEHEIEWARAMAAHRRGLEQ